MPKKLLVIGSGAIGIEFASFFNTLGADTTVVEVMDRILPVEDAEISAFREKAIRQAGDEDPGKGGGQEARPQAGQGRHRPYRKGRQDTTQEFDTVISAVGIVGNVENLGLEAGREDRPHPCRDR
jgi:dihydrolipoamide dehydrogenase